MGKWQWRPVSEVSLGTCKSVAGLAGYKWFRTMTGDGARVRPINSSGGLSVGVYSCGSIWVHSWLG